MKTTLSTESIELLETIAGLELIEYDVNAIITTLADRYFEHVSCQSTPLLDSLIEGMVTEWRQQTNEAYEC